MHQHAPEQIAIKTAWISLVSHLVLGVVKLVTGIVGHSYALVADAIESFTDFITTILLLFGLSYAKRPADENHPYGHGKAEPLITFVIVGILITSALVIAFNSIQNIRSPHESPEGFTLIVLGVIILWKEISYQYVSRIAKKTQSTALAAEAWHHRTDALSSVAAFIGICIALLLGPAYASADDWAALATTLMILYNSYRIFRPALGEVMDEYAYPELTAEIRSVAMTVRGITGTEKCQIRKTGMRYYVDLHIEVDGHITVTQGHDIAHHAKDKIMRELPQIADILIHVEPDDIAMS